MADDSGQLRTHVDRCLWIPRTEGQATAGWLSLQGFAFQNQSPVTVALALKDSAGGETFRSSFVPLSEHRRDVADTFPEAPVKCGFEMTFPLPEATSGSANPVLLFRVDEAEHSLPIPHIHDGADPAGLSAHFGLTGRSAVRLGNLLLNESERLGRVVIKRSKPITLFLDPTFGCNLDCPHCLSKMLRDQGMTRKSIKLDQVSSILSQYGETLIKATLALWGEPLLHKRFPELVSLFKAYEIVCHTSTNLSLELSDSVIDAVIASGLDEIRLSIDGVTQATYERYRAAGDLSLVLKNVGRLVAAKKRLGVKHPSLRWVFLTFPWNGHERDAAARLARDIGADHFECIHGGLHNVPPPLRARQPQDDAVAIGAVKNKLISAIRQRRRSYRHAGCDFLDHTLAINSDGTVFPCCYVPTPKDALGPWEALGADPFNSPPIQKLRRFIRRVGSGKLDSGPSPCAKCGTLRSGHVDEQLGFWAAFRLLTERAPR